MNKHFNEVITHSALGAKLSGVPGVFLEPKEDPKPNNNNVCTLINDDLSVRFDSITNLLNISKREFLRLALASAIDEANALASEIDVFEHETPFSLSTITLSDEESSALDAMTDIEKGAYLSEKWSSK